MFCMLVKYLVTQWTGFELLLQKVVAGRTSTTGERLESVQFKMAATAYQH